MIKDTTKNSGAINKLNKKQICHKEVYRKNNFDFSLNSHGRRNSGSASGVKSTLHRVDLDYLIS